MSDAKFWFWRFRVCCWCYWYLRHWPWNDLAESEWRDQFEFGDNAKTAFIEGWCRE